MVRPPSSIVLSVSSRKFIAFLSCWVLFDLSLPEGVSLFHVAVAYFLCTGHNLPPRMFLIMDAILAPSSLFYTIAVKPFLVIKCLLLIVPFWLHCRASVTKPIVFNFFKALRTSPETSNMKIGAAGFCWGGKHTVLLAQDTPSSRVHRPDTEAGQVQRLIDCAFTAHPSMLNVPEDIEPVTVPLSIAIGDVDMALKANLVYKTKDILEKKKAGDHEVVIYPGAKHGFAIRGDPTDPKQKEYGDQAEVQAVSWFSRWFGM
jgi:Dienelactone hydrolase family